MTNLNDNEYVLRKERLHKGIFCLPALLFAVPLVPIVLIIFFISTVFHKFNAVVQQSQPQPNLAGIIFLPVLMMTVPWILACLVVFLSTLLAYLKSEVTLTNQRLLFRTGFIMRVSGELPLENIETIFLVEPLLGRIFGFGTVSLTSVGGARFALRYIASPQVFHAALQNAVALPKASRMRTKPPAQAGSLASSATPRLPADDQSRFMPKG